MIYVEVINTYVVFGWGEWSGMKWNEMSKKYLKLIEIGRKFWKNLKECKIVMMRFVKKLSIGENGAFHLKLEMWYLAYDVWNGMEERMKFFKNHHKIVIFHFITSGIIDPNQTQFKLNCDDQMDTKVQLSECIFCKIVLAKSLVF